MQVINGETIIAPPTWTAPGLHCKDCRTTALPPDGATLRNCRICGSQFCQECCVKWSVTFPIHFIRIVKKKLRTFVWSVDS
eukprot:TRINITY_DN12066_c0_g1_i1.p2 TRINITY_DN12066_c0_g1~~TRINITY_DN12066_c0_g1_i1.p2  ORF type:complete len:81 (+),score=3.71 TRINITY_DN12066_c0_g1_i1:319-561(+)